ncbi:hypothetical protein [Salininema proteolyticum]|uniref:Uncharacterized protein n=1 Tax=Salininema proteolyticum TaxID=1607685 RepID=A0ABV8TZN2_9ACTN
MLAESHPAGTFKTVAKATERRWTVTFTYELKTIAGEEGVLWVDDGVLPYSVATVYNLRRLHYGGATIAWHAHFENEDALWKQSMVRLIVSSATNEGTRAPRQRGPKE